MPIMPYTLGGDDGPYDDEPERSYPPNILTSEINSLLEQQGPHARWIATEAFLSATKAEEKFPKKYSVGYAAYRMHADARRVDPSIPAFQKIRRRETTSPGIRYVKMTDPLNIVGRLEHIDGARIFLIDATVDFAKRLAGYLHDAEGVTAAYRVIRRELNP